MTLAHRTFDSYDAYVYDQGGKARGNRETLLAHLQKNTKGYTRIFREAAKRLKPGAVLCLGARTGAESLGAEAAGFTGSVGIDLHPVGPTVLRGDWHNLQFGDASFANIYCNSLDHCLDLDKMLAEVKRVLAADGRFYVMATNRVGATEEKWRQKPGNEALFWGESSDRLVEAICGHGFTVKHSWRDGKWGHYVLAVKA